MPQPVRAQAYYVYVANESEDSVMRLRFRDGVLATERKIPVGTIVTEIEGPHGLTVSPDGRHWFVSLAHGQPFGKVLRFSTEGDSLTGAVELGLFPATMAISPVTGLLHVANFNLHGGMIPSTITVVDPERMLEVGQVTTGIMPHGSRFSPDGEHHYSVAMMSHTLYEQHARTLQLSRTLALGEDTKPTWVALHPDQPLAYVAANGSSEILEIDLNAWHVRHRFDTPGHPYNLTITPDGTTIVATLKSAQAIGLYDAATGKERAQLPSTRALPHGVVVSPDGHYAFVSSEGIGAEPGAVDVVDMRSHAVVASALVGQQAGGIAFWKMTP